MMQLLGLAYSKLTLSRKICGCLTQMVNHIHSEEKTTIPGGIPSVLPIYKKQRWGKFIFLVRFLWGVSPFHVLALKDASYASEIIF